MRRSTATKVWSTSAASSHEPPRTIPEPDGDDVGHIAAVAGVVELLLDRGAPSLGGEQKRGCGSGQTRQGESEPGSGPTLRDCSGQDDACNDGYCQPLTETAWECRQASKPEGTACETDALYCTLQECDGGVGGPGQCLHVGIVEGQCLIDGNWDPGSSTCLEHELCFAAGEVRMGSQCEICGGDNTWQPKDDGVSCDDGDPGTQHDICFAAVCQDRYQGQPSLCRATTGTSCVKDILENFLYFIPGSCFSAKTWSEAFAECETAIAGGTGFGLVEKEVLALLATSGSYTDCSGSGAIHLDSEIAGVASATREYWTSSCLGLCPAPPDPPAQAYTIRFDGSTPSSQLRATSQSHAIICGKQL